jgi:xanthine dehydrogenase accessory factor
MFNQLDQAVKSGKGAAIVTVVKSTGSTPAETGKMMLVYEDGHIEGTIGGGNLEKTTIEKTVELIRKGRSELIQFDLGKDLAMNCGGHVEVFVRVVKPDYRLIIVGGGHIAYYLNQLAKIVHFKTTIFDNREEMLTEARYPNADELVLGDIPEKLSQYPLTENDFVVVVTHGHKHDEDALFVLANEPVRYIGAIGSRRKVKIMFDNLENRGISKEALSRIYSPIGLTLGGNSPEEIALGIMAEIQYLKTGRQLAHSRDLV